MCILTCLISLKIAFCIVFYFEYLYIYICLIANTCNALIVSIYHETSDLLTDSDMLHFSSFTRPCIAFVLQLTFFFTFLNFVFFHHTPPSPHPNGPVFIINLKLTVHSSQKTYFLPASSLLSVKAK